jgi:hypothetical protein
MSSAISDGNRPQSAYPAAKQTSRSQLLPPVRPTYGAFLGRACCESWFRMLDEPRNSEKAGEKSLRELKITATISEI